MSNFDEFFNSGSESKFTQDYNNVFGANSDRAFIDSKTASISPFKTAEEFYNAVVAKGLNGREALVELAHRIDFKPEPEPTLVAPTKSCVSAECVERCEKSVVDPTPIYALLKDMSDGEVYDRQSLLEWSLSDDDFEQIFNVARSVYEAEHAIHKEENTATPQPYGLDSLLAQYPIKVKNLAALKVVVDSEFTITGRPYARLVEYADQNTLTALKNILDDCEDNYCECYMEVSKAYREHKMSAQGDMPWRRSEGPSMFAEVNNRVTQFCYEHPGYSRNSVQHLVRQAVVSGASSVSDEDILNVNWTDLSVTCDSRHSGKEYGGVLWTPALFKRFLPMKVYKYLLGETSPEFHESENHMNPWHIYIAEDVHDPKISVMPRAELEAVIRDSMLKMYGAQHYACADIHDGKDTLELRHNIFAAATALANLEPELAEPYAVMLSAFPTDTVIIYGSALMQHMDPAYKLLHGFSKGLRKKEYAYIKQAGFNNIPEAGLECYAFFALVDYFIMYEGYDVPFTDKQIGTVLNALRSGESFKEAMKHVVDLDDLDAYVHRIRSIPRPIPTFNQEAAPDPVYGTKKYVL